MNPSQLSSDVLSHVRPHGHVIVPLGNGEPVALLDAIEAQVDAWLEQDLIDIDTHRTGAIDDRAPTGEDECCGKDRCFHRATHHGLPN